MTRSRFDGRTVTAAQDDARLGNQIERVFAVMADGEERTLAQIEAALGYDATQAAISARLRDFRKPQWGGHEVVRRRDVDDSGLFHYRLIRSGPLLDGRRSREAPPRVTCPTCGGAGRVHTVIVSPDPAPAPEVPTDGAVHFEMTATAVAVHEVPS